LPEPEFSCVVHPSELAPGGARYALDANEAERAALARRFGLVAIESFSAEISLKWMAGNSFLCLQGRIRAVVVQTCVVTLEPVRAEIDQPIDILYRPDAGEEEVDVDPEKDIEPLEGDSLDIGEIAAEEMVLMLDPYPRAPSATLEGAGPQAEETQGKGSGKDQESGSPFEILAGFRRNQ
jgi:uncharacterized metal-binding protein YceD (DUF177 family)